MKPWRGSLVATIREIGRWPMMITAVALAVLVLELFWRHPIDLRVERVPTSSTSPATRATRSLQPLSAFQGVTDRPLFTPDRKPYEPPVESPPVRRAPPPVPVAPTLRFTLSAVITTPSAQIALLKNEGSSQVQKLAVGESYDGWTLVEVRPDSVVLRNGEIVRTIELNEKTKTKS